MSIFQKMMAIAGRDSKGRARAVKTDEDGMIENKNIKRSDFIYTQKRKTGSTMTRIEVPQWAHGVYVVIEIRNITGSPKMSLRVADRIAGTLEGASGNILQHDTGDFNFTNYGQFLVIHVSPDAIYHKEYGDVWEMYNARGYISIPHVLNNVFNLEVNVNAGQGESIDYSVALRWLS